jgi:hypothetical protein
MLALSYSKLFIIILAITLSARAVTVQTFPQYFQTGTKINTKDPLFPLLLMVVDVQSWHKL